MSGWRKRQIMECMMNERTNEQLLAKSMAMESAFRFLNGHPDWNDDLGSKEGLDGDLVWLTRQVLFGPAVVHLSTGKVV